MTNVPLIVDSEWLASRLDDPKLRLLDATTFLSIPDKDGAPGLWSGEKAFAEEHIPTSKNVFFGSHSNPETRLLLSDEQLRETFGAIGALDTDKTVITYCGGGIAATWNALLLNKLGQENVAIYDGSMNEWAADETCPLVY